MENRNQDNRFNSGGSTAGFPVLPDYRGACLSNVVPALLGPSDASGWMPAPIRSAKTVVLLLVDGMGWEQLQERAALTPVLSAMEGGPITTVAPTTTTTALTSLVTGAAPGEHGLIGYQIYIQGQVLNALRWTAGDRPSRCPQEHRPRAGAKPGPLSSDGGFRQWAGASSMEPALPGPTSTGWTTRGTS